MMEDAMRVCDITERKDLKKIRVLTYKKYNKK